MNISKRNFIKNSLFSIIACGATACGSGSSSSGGGQDTTPTAFNSVWEGTYQSTNTRFPYAGSYRIEISGNGISGTNQGIFTITGHPCVSQVTFETPLGATGGEIIAFLPNEPSSVISFPAKDGTGRYSLEVGSMNSVNCGSTVGATSSSQII